MDRLKLSTRNVVESILVLLLFVALLVALYDVMHLFFGVLTFALIFCVSFVDVFERLCRWLGGKRNIAAVLYVIVLLVIVALPVILFFSAFHAHANELNNWVEAWKTNGLPDLPAWVKTLPIVGHELQLFWVNIQNDPEGILHENGPQAKSMIQQAIHSGTGILGVSIQFIAGIALSAFFLAKRHQMLNPFRAAAQHLFGEQDGGNLLQITEQAIKGVSIGVMGTAFITAGISWIGLAIAGIPFSLGISALIFFLVVIQVGPLPVWIPLTIWLFIEGQTGMGIFMTVYGIVVIVLENIARPVLIAKSGKIPFLVLFVGVIGGLSAWGFTGMFKGAIVVAIGYTVFNSWLEKKNGQNQPAADSQNV
ncbi:MAG: putative PurR-regulated permease PerM [Chitinophagaceae bacterium]|nr:putative PurR-regulated permease PerM [Chitinophagaceae bacterium]